ncbi:ABC-F family ATP-binding cassette domain-containing protein [Sporosarcina sp. Marseille-Q4063]|uniref:ABC-F family ATP-binding cassette domain-containing protein n=1 Tax=Sporosarcina sp. Marseille-Q4063 TaxID=2810514 RepID=UPI001BAFF9EF|nr:ABC-F family ATP-binding cassette domain-containing protein [Sporosarcina sp. Marseille-Q4063]QUW23709.1 ABC-F family ATP-binding cassette domain-containing protein [Sporosarcina sp. Marseille-Q4063]
MIVLQVNALTKSFSGTTILDNVQLEVHQRDRVALVGRNGAGKSTLLKIIAGEMAADSGDLIIPKNIRIGYLEQHSGIDSSLTVWDEMMTVFEPLRVMERRIRSLEEQMADPAIFSNSIEFERVSTEYDELQTEFSNSKGYQYEADTRSVLHGMRFYPEDYTKQVNLLSGGQKTRLALAKMLLSSPDLLILDEPTNHLDIETLSWLEKYLVNYEGALLIVSHDRYFLDEIVTIVYEVSRHKVAKYLGNYSAYLSEKAKNYERDLKMYEREASERANLEDFIQRNIARASTSKMAQSRRKMLERTNWMESPDGDEKSANFTFSVDRPSGNDVLAVDNLAIGYDNGPVSENLNLRVYKGDRIALIGPNGVGKSTLLKTIVKRQTELAGEIRYGTNVQFGYYDQEQATLAGNDTVLEELWSEWPMMNEKDIRSVLGRFLFTGDDAGKPVTSLSGGEKARLSLAKLMLKKSNTLILDEPTNHLDLDSKEILENALDDFPGTILFVSHDRYFINRLATKVIDIGPQGAVEYLGDYDYYVEKKQEQEELLAEKERALVNKPPVANKQDDDREIKRQERRLTRAIAEIEDEITALDERIASFQEELSNPEYADNHVKLMEIQKNIDNLQAEHDEKAENWLTLQEQLEHL